MAYLRNLASDLRHSIRGRKLYKSLRDTPNFQGGVYNFAYNLGTISAVTGNKTLSPVRGLAYNSLQGFNDMSSLIKHGPFRGGTRRLLVYRVVAPLMSRAISSFLPTGSGILNRQIRVAAGRFTSLRLQRLDSKVRSQLYGEFRIDSNKIDRYAASPTSNVGIDLSSIQKTMQAIAIANAPDPYAINKFNRKTGPDENMNQLQTELGDSDGVMSAFSFQTLPDSDIERLMSRQDIANIMGENALRGNPDSIMKFTSKGKQHAGTNDAIMEGLYGPKSKHRQAFQRDDSSFLSDYQKTTDLGFMKIVEEEVGIGATYVFGSNASSGVSAQREIKDFINNTILAADAMVGPNRSGVLQPEQIGMAIAMKLDDLQAQYGDAFLSELGKMNDVMRFIHGDDADVRGKPRFQRNRTGSLNIYSKDDLENFNYQTTEERTVPINERRGTGFLITSMEEDVTVNDRFGLKQIIGQQAIEGPDTYDLVPTGKFQKEKRNRFRRGSRPTSQSVSLGSLKYIEEIVHMNNDFAESSINYDTTLRQDFSDNPMRHNFVPNRRQIQSTIHAQDPDTTQPDSLVEHRVTFGGKTSKSKTADGMRDAFQIEYGGPATDKAKQLYNRTDGFVYTPSLFMYRSLIGAAQAFGLSTSKSMRKPLGVIKGGVSQLGIKAGQPTFDATAFSGGVKANAQTNRILEEIYQKSVKKNNNPLMRDGMVMLQKSEVLRVAKDKATLELASETLQDAIFGGADMTRTIAQREALGRRRKFNRVISSDPVQREIDIHKAQKQFGSYSQKVPDIDERFIGMEFYEKPSPLFEFEEDQDGNGQTIYRIIGSRFDDLGAPTDDDSPVAYGNVINRFTKRNIAGSDSIEFYSDPRTAEDFKMLTDLERAGISEDEGIDSPRFAQFSMENAANRAAQLDLVKTRIKAQVKANLSVSGFPDNEIATLASKIADQLIGDISRGKRGGALLSQQDLSLINDLSDQGIQQINRELKRTGLYSFNFRSGQSNKNYTDPSPINLGKGSREEAFRDAETRNSLFGLFNDPEITKAFSIPPGMIERFERGEISYGELVNKLSETSQKKLRDLVENSGFNPTRVGDHPRNRDITGTSIQPIGRTGEKPNAIANSTRFKNTLGKSREDVKTFGLSMNTARAKDSTATQTDLFVNRVKYVTQQIRIIVSAGEAQSAQRERAIQQAIDKARENDNVRLSYFEFLRRGGQSANTIQDIVIFLESYRNIDGVGPSTQENPEQFEDGYGRENDLPF